MRVASLLLLSRTAATHLGSTSGMSVCMRAKAYGQAKLRAVGQCLGRLSCRRKLCRHSTHGSFTDWAKIHTCDGLRMS